MIQCTDRLLARAALVGFAALAGLSPAHAQMTWTPGGPLGIDSATLCYDPIRDRMVQFSTSGVTSELHPTFGWVPISLTGPQPSYAYSTAFAQNRQRVVCSAYNTTPSRTWEWDGTSWTFRTLPPQFGFNHHIGHTGRGTVVGFGGYSPGNDLYEWTGTTWNLIPATVKPPRPSGWTQNNEFWNRYYAASSYDARRDKVVLFGSYDMVFTSPTLYQNFQPVVWEWDATNGWVQRTVTFPIPYMSATAKMHFDVHRGTMILTVFLSGQVTCEWDGGAAWNIVPVTQPAQSVWNDLTPGYDSKRNELYAVFYNFPLTAYGGWILTQVNPAHFDVHGAGCPGTLGQSELNLVHPWTRAWLGNTLQVQLTNLPQSVGWLVAGLSDQQTGGTPLPAPLDPLGMPGCMARVSPDLCFLLSGASNTATLSAPVPNIPALVGVQLFAQGVALDLAANSRGLTVSNSVRVTVGNR